MGAEKTVPVLHFWKHENRLLAAYCIFLIELSALASRSNWPMNLFWLNVIYVTCDSSNAIKKLGENGEAKFKTITWDGAPLRPSLKS